MIDLTKITTPVGLLDEETEEALKAHGGPYEFYTGFDGWRTIDRPSWAIPRTYRVKPEPLTKPSINWDHVAKGWNWLARDHNGSLWLYKGKPKTRDTLWSICSGEINARTFKSLNPGTCDWKDSLVCRPGYEGFL